MPQMWIQENAMINLFENCRHNIPGGRCQVCNEEAIRNAVSEERQRLMLAMVDHLRAIRESLSKLEDCFKKGD